MAELQGGDEQPRIHDRESLSQWLDALPSDRRRDAARALAARSALRVLPMIEKAALRSYARPFEKLAQSVFWATALARVAGKYRSRFNALPFAAAAHEAFGAAADFEAKAAYAAGVAATAAAFNADAYTNAAHVAADAALNADDIWRSLSVDVAALEKDRLPSRLASDPLWPQGAPTWADASWARLRVILSKVHWQPWLDWYQRRLDGTELPEEIELLFATVPVAPRTKDPAEQNALLAQEIARLMSTTPRGSKSAKCDFFISYSNEDESFAREAASALEEAGYSIFVQYEDMAVGANFVREMQRGLGGSERLIALLSPAYEASDHCQAEWVSFYNRDPSGRERRIIALLVRETSLNSLAKQVVYKSLIGLTPEQRKKAILDVVAPRKPPPSPVENISSPFTFGWTASAKLTIVAGPQNTPVFPFAQSEADHRARLEACQKQAKRLVDALKSGQFNVRPSYLRVIEEYLEELPSAPGAGSLLESDCAARTLRGLLGEDAEFLPVELKERIRRVFELHGSLLWYYPGVERFYADVRSGQLTQPLPLDAVASFVQTVEEHTPDVFDDKVARELQHKVQREPEASSPDVTTASSEAALNLPPDPFADVDPKKSHAFGIASTINALYKGFLKGKDVWQSLTSWEEIAHKLAESAGPVIEWLRNFLP
jgi:hypothetical protein